MPEGEFETTDLKEKLDEATEQVVAIAEHRSHWMLSLSLSTALIAVLAAIAALESGAYSNEALMQKNEAVLAQAKASDQWAYYQAKGVKAVVYAGQGATEKSAKETKDQEEISRNAREFEDDVKKASLQSEKSLAHHHRFAYAVTLFQISIALSAVAALSRQKLVWVIGLAISVVALLFFLSGFWLFA